MARRGTKLVCSWQALTGAATIAAAAPVAARIGGSSGAPAWLAPLIAVLGVRQLAQAALVSTVDDPLFLRGGAGVDVLHAASMLPVLALPRYRVAAATTIAVAAISAAGQLAVADRVT